MTVKLGGKSGAKVYTVAKLYIIKVLFNWLLVFCILIQCPLSLLIALCSGNAHISDKGAIYCIYVLSHVGRV